ncbi:DEAD/DEAH box helicase/Helicase conserved C-terminal domain containing protein, putative [Angomonas deanei]|uniref:ATP-dependent RNA helicase n=1 Tax=Angomonas deanei TaxID=59799 RepID=A0A7G2C6E9_9TRYP|nr:DEAD/DEAH box helicase/Helicase conserved C-terminal domain containing protein, putative [Angomonas deanei]
MWRKSVPLYFVKPTFFLLENKKSSPKWTNVLDEINHRYHPYTPKNTQHEKENEFIKQLVRSAVEEPLGEPSSAPPHDEKKIPSTPDKKEENPFSLCYTTHVVDKHGMPVVKPQHTTGTPQTFTELLALCPPTMKQQMETFLQRHPHLVHLSPVQQNCFYYTMEERDVLCVAPTAVGKTLAYVLPTLLQLSSRRQDDHQPIKRSSIEKLLHHASPGMELCPYCELNMHESPFCPLTGLPHRPAAGEDTEEKSVPLQRLSEAPTHGVTPSVLVLLPTAQLTLQTYHLFRQLRGEFRVEYLIRAKTEEEQKRHLRLFADTPDGKGVDILCTTPETILPALYKRKLSLKHLQTLILDEVDDLISTNHFEKVKIILGAIPKAHLAGNPHAGQMRRPQRLLFGASLPPVAYQMIREKFLLPSHRFILCETKTDRLGYQPTAASLVPSDPQTNVAATAASTGIPSIRPSLKHHVLLVGRVEKMHKLVSLFEEGKINGPVIIFCNSRNNVGYVKTKLEEMLNHSRRRSAKKGKGGEEEDAVHSRLHQSKAYNITTITSRSSSTAQDGVLKLFAKGISNALVCTDLLSRGMDFKGVSYVVNYDMPISMDVYIHRAGRCGRGGGALNYWIRKEQKKTLEGEERTAVPQHDYTQGYVYTFFQPENLKLAKPFVSYLRQHKQFIPPKLVEMSKYSFPDILAKHAPLQHAPTRPYRKDDPQRSTSVFSGTVLNQKGGRYGGYQEAGLTGKNYRPQ